MTHEVKTWVEFKQAVMSQAKRFEVRKDDRNYQVGDTLIQRFWSPISNTYDGDEMHATISYKLDGGQFGIEEGYCVLQLTNLIPFIYTSSTPNL